MEEIKTWRCNMGHPAMEFKTEQWQTYAQCPMCELRTRVEVLEGNLAQLTLDKETIERANRLLGDAERVEKAAEAMALEAKAQG